MFKTKKIFLTFIIACFAFKAKCQDTSLHKSAIAVCDCLTKNKIDDKSTPQQLQQVFLQCILTSSPDLVTKMMGNGQDNMQAAQETATNLALEMMKNGCPAFTKIAAGMAMTGSDSLNINMSNSPIDITAKPQAVENANGVVTKVEERDFMYITVKATTGRELEFIYYNYVPSSDEWIKDPANKLKNKNVSLSYTETEVYQPKIKQFINMKEIKTLIIK